MDHMSIYYRVSFDMLNVAWSGFNTLRSRQNGRQFPYGILKCVFLKENIWISIKISLNVVPNGSINNIPALVLIMAWRRPGDKPLFEPMMIIILMIVILTHICVTRPQWVNTSIIVISLSNGHYLKGKCAEYIGFLYEYAINLRYILV